MSKRNRPAQIAAVVTAYYPASHADVIVTKFLSTPSSARCWSAARSKR